MPTSNNSSATFDRKMTVKNFACNYTVNVSKDMYVLSAKLHYKFEIVP
jgi:hypothetical protein